MVRSGIGLYVKQGPKKLVWEHFYHWLKQYTSSHQLQNQFDRKSRLQKVRAKYSNKRQYCIRLGAQGKTAIAPTNRSLWLPELAPTKDAHKAILTLLRETKPSLNV